MNFGEMLEIIKDGKHRAYRKNWNGIKSFRKEIIQVPKELERGEERFLSEIQDLEEFKNPVKSDPKIINPPMFIYVVKGRVIPNSEVREPLKSWLNGKDMDITDHIDMKSTDGKIISGWSPTQSDLFSDDWEICWQDLKLKVTQDEIIPGPIIRTKEEMDIYLKKESGLPLILPVEQAPKGEGIKYIQVPKTKDKLDIAGEELEAIWEDHLSNQKKMSEMAKEHLNIKDPSMFVIQPFAVLQEKLKSQKVLWVDSDPKLVRAKIAVELFGGDFKDSGSRYLDLFLKQDDLIIVFGKGLKREIQEQITDMGLTHKRLLSIEVKIDDIPTIKENIIKQLSEVYKDG